jgi:hypothetical protein
VIIGYQGTGAPAAAPTQSRNTPANTGGAPPGNTDPLTAEFSKLMTSGNPQDEIMGLLLGQSMQQMTQAGLAGTLGQAQLAMTGPQLAVAQQELGTNTGYDLANLLLGQQQIGLSQQNIGTQQAVSAAQQGVEQQQYGLQQTQYPEQFAQAALANKNAVQALQQQGAIGGTLMTEGSKQRFATQAAEYGWQNADIFRNQQLAQLSQAGEQYGYAGQQAGYANQLAQLGLSAKAQGLSASQAMAQLGFGLQQLGYQASPEQYLSQLAGAQGTQAQGLAGVGAAAGLIGGTGANLFGGL